MNYIIYIISLKRAVERRLAVEKRAKELGLNYQIIDAVDGRSLTDEQKSLVDTNSLHVINLPLFKKVTIDFTPTAPEIGCALSHIKSYHTFINSTYDIAFFMEDDCILSANFKNIINSIVLEQTMNKWDVINFSANSGLRRILPENKIKIDEKYYMNMTGNGNKYLDALFNRRRFVLGAFLYGLNKRSCSSLLGLFSKVQFPADFFLGHVASNHLKTYIVKPHNMIDSYTSFESTIESDAPDRESNLKIY